MAYFNHHDGNNVELTGNQADGQEKSPGYNTEMGFKDDLWALRSIKLSLNTGNCD